MGVKNIDHLQDVDWRHDTVSIDIGLYCERCIRSRRPKSPASKHLASSISTSNRRLRSLRCDLRANEPFCIPNVKPRKCVQDQQSRVPTHSLEADKTKREYQSTQVLSAPPPPRWRPPKSKVQSPKSKVPHSKRYLLIHASRGSSTAEFFILALSQSSFSRPLKKSGAGQEQLIKAATTDCLL